MQGLEHEGHPDMNPRAPLFCDPSCENFICCVWQQGEGCEFDHDTPTFCYHPNLSEVCNPWTAGDDWPACLEWEDDEDDEEGAPCGTNVCGCAINCDVRRPGGCVQVEDTELGMEGVQNVKVIWWDGWFKIKTTYTNETGCWSIPGHREKGKGYMWVEFKNHRAKIRSGLGSSIELWRLLIPVKDYVGQFGGVYNNIYTQYGLWDNEGSIAHRYWGAATVINGLEEFEELALEDGINPVSAPLDIFTSMTSSIGSALMKNYQTKNNVISAVIAGLLQVPDLAGEAGVLFGNADLTDYIYVEDVVYPFLWDVMIGTNHRNSDRLYSTIFHEQAHSSHFTQAGPFYWANLIAAEVQANGWGDENSPGAEIIAMSESWAEHIGDSYTHRRYGLSNSLTPLGTTWELELEGTWNDSPNHIPIGVHLDLIDPGIGLETACDEDNDFSWHCTNITDNVAGFTNGQLFSVLTSGTSTVEIYRDRIIETLGGNPVEINDLFNSY